MRKLALCLCFGVLGLSGAWAQSLNAYLQTRTKVGVKAATSSEDLALMVGAKTLEIKGVFRGSIFVDGQGVLMMDCGEGPAVNIRVAKIPDWLIAGSSIRCLIQASREAEYGSLDAILVAAIPESEMTYWENKNRKVVASSSVSRPSGGQTSRSGSPRGPAPMQGEIRIVPDQPKREWNLPTSEALPYYYAFIKAQNKRLSDAEAEQIARAIIGFSIQFEVDARLIVALVIAESSFNPNAKSGVGATGLGQLMPGTARALGVNPNDPTENLYGSVKYLAGHIGNYKAKTGDDFESIVLALAAYNAGPGAVKRHGGVPPYRETQNYVRKVISIYRQLCGE